MEKTKNHTFIISFDNSCIDACISGTFTNACMYFITSVLFERLPVTLSVAGILKKFLSSTFIYPLHLLDFLLE